MRATLPVTVLFAITIAGCGNTGDLTTPTPVIPFEPTQLCHGTYAAAQLETWFQTATPAVLGVRGAVFIDHDEVAQCLRIGVVDRPAGEAAEQALAAVAVPRDVAIIELTEPVQLAGQ